MDYEQLKQQAYEVFKTFNVKKALYLEDALVEIANFNTEYVEYDNSKTVEEQIDGLIDMIMFAWQLNFRLGGIADNIIGAAVSYLLYLLENIFDLKDSSRLKQNIQSVIQSQYQKVYKRKEAEKLLLHYNLLGVDVYLDKVGEGKGYLVRSRISQEVQGVEYPKDKILKNKVIFVDPVIIL